MGDAMTMITQAIAMLQQAQMKLPPGTPAHKATNHAVGQLSKHVAQGQPAAGTQMTFLRDLMRGLMRNFNLQQVMAQGGGSPDQGGGGSPAMGGGPQPSPALPGA